MKPTSKGCIIFGIVMIAVIALLLAWHFTAGAQEQQSYYLPNVAKYPVYPRPPVRAYPETGEIKGELTIVVDVPHCSSAWAEIGLTYPLDGYPPSIENPECIDGLAVLTLRFYGPVEFDYLAVTVYRFGWSWPERYELWGQWEAH